MRLANLITSHRGKYKHKQHYWSCLYECNAIILSKSLYMLMISDYDISNTPDCHTSNYDHLQNIIQVETVVSG